MARIPKDPYKARLAEFRREQKALKRIEKFKAKAQKQRDKEATKERKHQEQLESLRRKTEKNIAHAEHQESLHRRRVARRKAVAAHPLGLGKRSFLPKNKIKKTKGKPWYDMV